MTKKFRPRRNKGFSVEEIKRAGLTLQDARQMNIIIDERRKSCREENVELLKKLIEEGVRT